MMTLKCFFSDGSVICQLSAVPSRNAPHLTEGW